MNHHIKKKKLLREYFFNTYKGVINKNRIDDVMNYQLDKSRSYEYLDIIESDIDKKSKILDFGSGFGEFIILLNKMNFKAFGVENCKKSFDISLLSWSEQFKQKPRFFHCNSYLPFKDDSFDIITLWNAVEHIDNLDFHLREIVRVLKKGGKIFILAPNYFSFRKEAHYHVPWAPFLSKKLSLKYLSILGKNPNFNGMKILGTGRVTFGDNFHSGYGCEIITSNHNFDNGNKIPYDETFITKDVVIGDNVWFGNHVTVLGGVSIGEGAIIQAKALVHKDVPDYAIVGGNPCDIIKFRNIEHYKKLKSEKKFH